MMARVLRSLALCMVVLAGVALPQHSAAQDFTIAATRAESQTTLPRSLNTKFPAVAGLGNQVVAAANSRADATAWQKVDTADSFGNGVTLGDADGQSDYTSTYVAANLANNTFYAIWTNQATDEVRFASKGRDAANWSESRRIARVDFPHFARIAAHGNNVMAVWREVNPTNDGKIIYRFSTDNGNSWGGGRVSGRSTLTNADVAVNPSGQFVVSFADVSGDVFLARWNGSGFDIEGVQGDGNYYSQADVGIGPSGNIIVLYREEGRGVYFRERQPNGTWNSSGRLVSAGGRNVIRIGIDVDIDSQGNVYVNWISTADGDEDAYFTFRPAGSTTFEPLAKHEGPGPIYNGSNGWTLTDRAYGHYVSEYFAGSDLVTRYFRFSADAVAACAGTIAFENNAEVINNTTIRGTIAPSQGCTPTQARVQLNTQDSNAAPQTFASAFQLEVPPASVAQCTQTVNVQLLQNGNAGPWFSRTIRVDPGTAQNPVNANVSLEPIGMNKDLLSNGSSMGDPRYTPKANVNLRVQDAGDCSGLNTFSTPSVQNRPITSSNYVEEIALPAQPGQSVPRPGVNQVPVSVVDKAGNLQTFNPTIIYDPIDTDGDPTDLNDQSGRPVWSTGSQLTPSDNTGSILRTIQFSGVRVTDNLYDPDGQSDNLNDDFWGVWVASEYLGAAGSNPPAPNADNAALNWAAARVDSRTCTAGNGCSFSAPVNLFSGLGFGPDTGKAGQYRVYVRVLDGAGNPSTRTETVTFTLAEGYQLPSSALTVIFK
jgi:hypothetical protein